MRVVEATFAGGEANGYRPSEATIREFYELVRKNGGSVNGRTWPLNGRWVVKVNRRLFDEHGYLLIEAIFKDSPDTTTPFKTPEHDIRIVAFASCIPYAPDLKPNSFVSNEIEQKFQPSCQRYVLEVMRALNKASHTDEDFTEILDKITRVGIMISRKKLNPAELAQEVTAQFAQTRWNNGSPDKTADRPAIEVGYGRNEGALVASSSSTNRVDYVSKTMEICSGSQTGRNIERDGAQMVARRPTPRFNESIERDGAQMVARRPTPRFNESIEKDGAQMVARRSTPRFNESIERDGAQMVTRRPIPSVNESNPQIPGGGGLHDSIEEWAKQYMSY
ncbi:hypothetical protein BJ508DRAFT_334514 [Ascobolus immersus RN42]|uniref:Uncharacterized protein n=1 Tax=Ascobolus immersus RN42 TaxID=1160509 RepID=A0A3N4HHM0_ASCIM|nr:hypothetical protein BJ508DRAFT_334514 [Ascobolus immersus RN42]